MIESHSFGYSDGDGGGYETAFPRIVSPSMKGVVEGLRSGEYLTAPATGALNLISTQPLVPVDGRYEETRKLAAILLERPKKTVADES